MSYEGSRRAPSTRPGRFVNPDEQPTGAYLGGGRFATPEGPAPKPPLPPVNPGGESPYQVAYAPALPAPAAVDPDDRLVPYERAVDLIKNVLVIVTCAAILYTLWVGYRAVAEFGNQLQQLPL